MCGNKEESCCSVETHIHIYIYIYSGFKGMSPTAATMSAVMHNSEVFTHSSWESEQPDLDNLQRLDEISLPAGANVCAGDDCLMI